MLRKLSIAAVLLLILAVPAYADPATYNGYPVVNVVVNGNPLVSDVPAIIVGGRTLLPVRAVAQALGANVAYDADTQTVTLTASAPTSQSADVQQKLADAQAQVSALQTTVQHLSDRLRDAGLPYQDPIPAPAQPQAGSRLNPYPVGTSVTVTGATPGGANVTVKVSLLKVIRGADCWTMVQQANMFNKPAPAGQEYVCAQMSSTLVAISDPNASESSDWRHWSAVSNGVDSERPLVVPPKPNYEGRMYQGGTITGWGVYQVSQTDKNPLVVFGRDYNGTGGYWFKTA